jgi:putative endonuclease
MDIGEVRSSILLSSTMTDAGYVYILKSLSTLKYYVGSTNDLKKRFNDHKSGYVKSTRNLRPLELVFFKKFDTLKQARQVEYKLKKFKSKEILQRIIRDEKIRLVL